MKKFAELILELLYFRRISSRMTIEIFVECAGYGTFRAVHGVGRSMRVGGAGPGWVILYFSGDKLHGFSIQCPPDDWFSGAIFFRSES